MTSVAMEATGVYWIPVYDILEARGLEVLLVNARHVKHVPGRKSDVEDCEWLRELHSVGLLRGSFRPAGPIRALRALVRHRDVLVQTAGTYVQRMQKALTQMNLLLPRVVSDIVGTTGLTILRALVAGERDPHVLAQHRDPHCKASVDEIAAALTGHYRDEHVFVLTQNLALFDMCQTQLLACDTAIEVQLQALTATVAPPTTPLPRPRITRRRGNEPHVDIRPELHHLTGVDLTQIDGLAPYSALKLIAEIGTDPTRWPTEHHFTAWLTLAPQNRISGGRRLSSRTQPSANRAAAVLRVAAMSLIRSQTALGAFWRLRDIFHRHRAQPVREVVQRINPILRGWVRYFAIGQSSRCFSSVCTWVDMKIQRHWLRTRQRPGFGWRRWRWLRLSRAVGVFLDYDVRPNRPTAGSA